MSSFHYCRLFSLILFSRLWIYHGTPEQLIWFCCRWLASHKHVVWPVDVHLPSCFSAFLLFDCLPRACVIAGFDVKSKEYMTFTNFICIKHSWVQIRLKTLVPAWIGFHPSCSRWAIVRIRPVQPGAAEPEVRISSWYTGHLPWNWNLFLFWLFHRPGPTLLLCCWAHHATSLPLLSCFEVPSHGPHYHAPFQDMYMPNGAWCSSLSTLLQLCYPHPDVLRLMALSSQH